MDISLEWTTCRDSVAEFIGIEAAKIGRGTHIYDELGIDSLGMFSLGMHLIALFQVKVPLSEVATIATVGDIFDTLERYRSELARG